MQTVLGMAAAVTLLTLYAVAHKNSKHEYKMVIQITRCGGAAAAHVLARQYHEQRENVENARRRVQLKNNK